MITRRDLVRALGRDKRVADWSVVERAQEIAVIDDLRSVIRRENRARISVAIHVDTSLGRGTAQLALDVADGSASTLVAQGVALASAAVGAAWKTVPPAAPATVEVIDTGLPKDLTRAARDVLASMRGAAVKARCSVMREKVTVVAKSGFHDDWPASELRVDALVTVGDRSLELVREARRLADLELTGALTDATADLQELAQAGAPPSITGPVDLVLETDAMLHGDQLGVWSVFAIQADSVLERQGLTRLRTGSPIAPGAAQVPEPLTVSSDGARDHALRSAPLSEDGVAIRRFDLVERGIARGVALTMREAALRGREPNGGIRNLVISPGLWNGSLARRTLRVRRLRALSIEPYTGAASLEIALGFDHDGDTEKSFTGGTIRLDLIAALARARRRAVAKDPYKRGAYIGPPSLLIEGVELVPGRSVQ